MQIKESSPPANLSRALFWADLEVCPKSMLTLWQKLPACPLQDYESIDLRCSAKPIHPGPNEANLSWDAPLPKGDKPTHMALTRARPEQGKQLQNDLMCISGNLNFLLSCISQMDSYPRTFLLWFLRHLGQMSLGPTKNSPESPRASQALPGTTL